jgi:hypothetical protein
MSSLKFTEGMIIEDRKGNIHIIIKTFKNYKNYFKENHFKENYILVMNLFDNTRWWLPINYITYIFDEETSHKLKDGAMVELL